MVGVFAGLKWRLVSSRVRAAGGAAKAWLILAWCLVVLVLAVLVFGLAALRTQPDIARNVVIALFSAQLLSWVLAPMVAVGVDETVDPAKFALLPLTTGTLQKGLLAASLIGYLPVANAFVLIGAALALSSTWALLPVALLCAAVQLVLCVVLSRAASTAMSGLMSGRRGRDLGMAVGSVLFLVYIGLSFLLNRGSASMSADGSASIGRGAAAVSRVLSWGPNGALAGLPSFLADKNWGRASIAALTAVAVLALGWFWWSRALVRSLTSVPSTTSGSAPARSAGVADRSAGVADSERGMVGLIMARDRLLTWRDPMRRIPWLMVAALAVLWPLIVVPGHGSLFAVAFPAVMVGVQAGNQYGVEGTGVWLHMVAFADRTRARGEALGHSVFVLIPGAAIIVLAVFVQAFVRGDLRWVPPALGVCLAVMGGSVAASGYFSARLPYAMKQSRKSMFGNSIPGQKGRTVGSVFASWGAGIVVGLPTITLLVLALTVSPAWGWAALLIGPISAAVAVLIGARMTADCYLSRMPEILGVVALGDRT